MLLLRALACPWRGSLAAVRVVLSTLPLPPGLGSNPAGTQVPAEGLHHAAVPRGGLLLLLLPVVRERDGGCGFLPRASWIPFLWMVFSLSPHLFLSLVEPIDKQSWLRHRLCDPATQLPGNVSCCSWQRSGNVWTEGAYPCMKGCSDHVLPQWHRSITHCTHRAWHSVAPIVQVGTLRLVQLTSLPQGELTMWLRSLASGLVPRPPCSCDVQTWPGNVLPVPSPCLSLPPPLSLAFLCFLLTISHYSSSLNVISSTPHMPSVPVLLCPGLMPYSLSALGER